MLGQPTKAILPKDAVAREPTKRRAQGGDVKLAAVHSAFGLDLQQARVLDSSETGLRCPSAYTVEIGSQNVPAQDTYNTRVCAFFGEDHGSDRAQPAGGAVGERDRAGHRGQEDHGTE